MWGKIVAHTIVFLMGSFAALSCWLVWRKGKDEREQEDIEKRIENIPQVEIPPLALDRLKERILHDIEIYRRGGGTEEEIKILQMPQEPKEIEPCSGCRPNLKTITKGGG